MYTLKIDNGNYNIGVFKALRLRMLIVKNLKESKDVRQIV